MAKPEKTMRKCEFGHEYYKSSDCPVCPLCEIERRSKDGFLAKLSAPARRALERHGILTLSKLSTYTEKEVRQLHGIGKTGLFKLSALLAQQHFTFKQ